MQNKLIYILLLIPFLAMAQKPSRELLRGRVVAVADSLMVENIQVKNITSHISAVTDRGGNFTIYARPADTLVFTGIAVRDAMMIVKKDHFTDKRLIIPMDVNVTVIDDVMISPLTGNLNKDSRDAKTKNFTPMFNSGGIVKNDIRTSIREYKYREEQNNLVDPVNRELVGVNFVKIYKSIFKPKKKKNEAQYYTQRNFAEVAQERFTFHFFTETLKIPKDEIGLFLVYCDEGNWSQALLKPEKEFELTDYLVTKSREYLKTRK